MQEVRKSGRKKRQVKMDFSKWREKKDQTERQRNEKTSEEERERKVTQILKKGQVGEEETKQER